MRNGIVTLAPRFPTCFACILTLLAMGQRLKGQAVFLMSLQHYPVRVLRVRSMAAFLFRDALLSRGFVEIPTPKLTAGGSEGGSRPDT